LRIIAFSPFVGKGSLIGTTTVVLPEIARSSAWRGVERTAFDKKRRFQTERPLRC
jgi:hypothetical protein